MKSLAGKVVIVTGASSGIGRSAALLLAKSGARLILGARGSEGLNDISKEIADKGGTAAMLAGDVKEEAYAKALVSLAVNIHGRLDGSFNCAGIADRMGPTTNLSLEDWNETIATNLTGAFLGSKHQIAAMLEGGSGSVVLCSGVVGNAYGFPGAAAYAASKAGIVGLTKALASEFGPKGVRVNAILPGSVDTPSYRRFAQSAESQQFMADLHALKRIATSEEIAESALFLLSDSASFMTGASVVVDGGTSITRT